MAFQAHYLSFAHQPANASDTQVVANRHAVDFLHVGKAPVGQNDAISRDEVGFFEQQQVHG
ncbi:hypothetical protein D3C81_2036630 [compost metagenome]